MSRNKFFFIVLSRAEFMQIKILDALQKKARAKNISLRGQGDYNILVLAVIVAVWAAVDAAGGIAEAEFAAAFIVTAARAELRAIESREQPATAGLSCDGG